VFCCVTVCYPIDVLVVLLPCSFVYLVCVLLWCYRHVVLCNIIFVTHIDVVVVLLYCAYAHLCSIALVGFVSHFIF
jgi:hypothetical protein